MLIDLTRCVGCKACVYACKEINGLPPTETGRLNARTWTAIETKAGLNIKKQCMHCLDPSCVWVCPVAALQKSDSGAVTYDEDRCIGCRYCMVACPFSMPKYEWDRPLPRVQKCVFCSEKRLKQGLQPACTETCPTQTAIFGERDDLIRQSQNRIENDPGRYVDHIYGLEEAGGTSVLYLSSVPFAALGFPHVQNGEPYPKLTWHILSQIPRMVGISGVLMFGIWWITNRRTRVQETEHALENAAEGSAVRTEREEEEDEKILA